MEFSYFDRKGIIEHLKKGPFDLLVIGGGITGAGIALDASSRGLKTALLEKSDFASGTSSRSTKLIHGGLRYLKQLEFGLVKEVGSERAIVHRLAPHLVVPEKMLLPLYEKKGLGYWLTSFGLKLYDWLAGVKEGDRRRMLTRRQTILQEPLLKEDDIKGGAIYAEYRTDDARLTLEIMKTAVTHGACVLNYAVVGEFEYSKNSICGVKVRDVFTGEKFSVPANVVINATGPWVDELREVNRSKTGKHLHLTKGVHIVVPKERLPVTQSIYFDVKDGRMVFAIPRGRTTYIGTTDTDYVGEKDQVYCSIQDAAYLIDAVNDMFPSVRLKMEDIESSWAGLRPLIYEEGKSASELSRKDEIFESPSGLISIAGGKLTGYRKMAERIVNVVIKNRKTLDGLKPCRTQSIPLVSSRFKNYEAVLGYIQQVEERIKPKGMGSAKAHYLVKNYGVKTDDILNLYERDFYGGEVDTQLLKAEAVYCIEHEFVCTLNDFYIRRTGLLYFDIQKVVHTKNEIGELFKNQLGWTEERKTAEIEDLDMEIKMHTGFI